MLEISENHSTGKPAAIRTAATPMTEEERASAWLKLQIWASQTAVVTTTVELTPALAAVLLSLNNDNRRLSEDTVQKYARDIDNGSWNFNGEPIIVSRDGLLNDGQHRCEAVIAAGKAIEVVLVVGPNRETRFSLDQGKIRTAGDFLGMNGHKDALALAATAGFLWQYLERGFISSQMLYRPTKSEVLETVSQHPELASVLSEVERGGSYSLGGRSLLAFCEVVFGSVSNTTTAREFTKSIVFGASLGPKDPILYARNRIIAGRGRIKLGEKAEIIFRAWNAHRRRESPRTFNLQGGRLPAVER